MRHRVAGKKLGRTASHKNAMLRNMVTDFLDKERITTTLPKAKALRPVAEKMITMGRRESLHNRRRALGYVRRKEVVGKLFTDIGSRFSSRDGGYTRIIKLGTRNSDGAEMALLEMLGSEYKPKAAPKKKDKKLQKEKEKTERPLGT
jgi:large subunit ribosomal protein L17